MSTRTIIYGPPGTGKTTRLIKIMEEYLANGGQPNKICFTSFTKKSIDEAVERVKKRFNITKDQLPFFRTVHSLCMGLSGLKNNDVMQFTHKVELADLLGVEITTRRSIDGTSFGMKDGDKLFHLADYARCKKISLAKAWDETGREMQFNEAERFVKAYKEYKDSRLLVDFTDMLDRFLVDGYIPNVDILIVDEAQDLSTLQWECIFRLERSASRCYIAGDDDQAIYGWNGANVDTFIGLEGERIVLDVSHRLNGPVHRKAMEIVRRISTRVEKKFDPTDKEGGSVSEISFLEDLPLGSGTWLLLARNGYMLNEYEKFCIQEGYLYESAGYGPRQWPEMKAIINYERWRNGYELNEKQFEQIETFSSRVKNKDLPWFEYFDNITTEKIEYLRACKRNDEKFLSVPRIQINTIHGVKGGEAENVCLMADMANTTWKNMDLNPDEEHRVFYVGATRAINTLWLKTPKTNKYYEL